MSYLLYTPKPIVRKREMCDFCSRPPSPLLDFLSELEFYDGGLEEDWKKQVETQRGGVHDGKTHGGKAHEMDETLNETYMEFL